MKKMLLLTAGALLSLAACDSNEMDNNQSLNDGSALFSATIDGQQLTRAYNDQWEAGDMIGITGTCGTRDYTNVGYASTAGKENDFEFKEGDKIYYEDNGTVTFTAYYPWKMELSAVTTIDFATDAQSNQKNFDYLWAQKEGSKNKPTVDFSFTHRMSKMAITVKAGNDITYEEVKTALCSLENHLYQATFDRTNGNVTAKGDALTGWCFNEEGTPECTSDITFEKDKSSVTYGLILPPQAFENASLLFTAKVNTGDAAGTQSFTAVIDLSKFEKNGGENILKPGIQYNITINVNKTGLTIGTCSITNWQTYSHEINAGM